MELIIIIIIIIIITTTSTNSTITMIDHIRVFSITIGILFIILVLPS
jgi:hypothetical protein